MRITVLVDNQAPAGLQKEHGLSFLVETEDQAVLFDTGATDAWRSNLVKLGGDPRSIRCVAISHGHYDHAGGLTALPYVGRIPCHIHPVGVWPRYARDERGVRMIGIPGEVIQVDPRFLYNRSSQEILPGVTLSGEIPLMDPHFDPSAGRFFVDADSQRPDMFLDEQCLILRDGIHTAVLVGCSHRGVESAVLAAMKIAGTDHLDLLAGGLHLVHADDERLERVAAFLEEKAIDQIACCHCTGDRAFQYLCHRLGNRVVQGRAGMVWTQGSNGADTVLPWKMEETRG